MLPDEATLEKNEEDCSRIVEVSLKSSRVIMYSKESGKVPQRYLKPSSLIFVPSTKQEQGGQRVVADMIHDVEERDKEIV